MYLIKVFDFYISEQSDGDFDKYALHVQNGNTASFDNIDRQMRPVIKRMTYKYDMNDFDREDLVQEMLFFALILCFKYDDSKGRYVHYAYRSIRLKMYDYINNIGLERLISTSANEVYMMDSKHALAHVIVKESKEYYAEAIENLSNYEKTVWKLFMDRHTFEEISSIINRQEHSIINTLYRVKNKLHSVESLHADVDNQPSSRYSILELK